jgi:hypothetical protein
MLIAWEMENEIKCYLKEKDNRKDLNFARFRFEIILLENVIIFQCFPFL